MSPGPCDAWPTRSSNATKARRTLSSSVFRLVATRERDATSRNTEDDKVLRAFVAFEDLVGHASQGPGDITGAHHDPGGLVLQGTIGWWSRFWTRHSAEPPSPPHRTGR